MSAGPTRDAAEFTAFGLVADLRAALGDDGARMQDELIVWARAGGGCGALPLDALGKVVAG